MNCNLFEDQIPSLVCLCACMSDEEQVDPSFRMSFSNMSENVLLRQNFNE